MINIVSCPPFLMLGKDLSESILINLNFCMIYGIYCVWTLFNPPTQNTENFAITFLLCGWISFPLYVNQVYYINTIYEM